VIIFGSVWFLSENINKPVLKKQNRTGTGSNRLVLIQFSFFSLAGFFFSFLCSVQFFLFKALKKPKTDRFFKNSNRFNQFFFTVRFFWLFFFSFLNLIDFLVFLFTPKINNKSKACGFFFLMWIALHEWMFGKVITVIFI